MSPETVSLVTRIDKDRRQLKAVGKTCLALGVLSFGLFINAALLSYAYDSTAQTVLACIQAVLSLLNYNTYLRTSRRYRLLTGFRTAVMKADYYQNIDTDKLIAQVAIATYYVDQLLGKK